MTNFFIYTSVVSAMKILDLTGLTGVQVVVSADSRDTSYSKLYL